MSSTIQVRVDDELKAKSDSLFKDLGTDTTTAIRIFLTQAVAYNGFPFEIRRNSTVNSPYTPMSEESMLKKLDESKKHADQGQCSSILYIISEKIILIIGLISDK